MKEILKELHIGILSDGLVATIARLAGTYPGFKDWYQSILGGESIASSLLSSCIDNGVKSALFLGITTGQLDLVLEDLIEGIEVETIIIKYSSIDDNCIDGGCLDREIDLIKRRAELEQASLVHLSLSSDHFIVQRYLGHTSTEVKVNGHKLMFDALKIYFETSSELSLSNGDQLEVIFSVESN